MEITNDIKAKVFAQYLGQKARLTGNVTLSTLRGVLINDHKHWCVWLTGKTQSSEESKGLSYAIEDCKLILKPLSEITDEDAIEVCKLQWGNHYTENKLINALLSSVRSIEPQAYFANAYQFLQSRGYDLPQYLLGGKTLHECNLAIYEN